MFSIFVLAFETNTKSSINEACFGKPCGKRDGEDASIKFPGNKFIVSHCWGSCSRHFSFVEASAMNEGAKENVFFSFNLPFF